MAATGTTTGDLLVWPRSGQRPEAGAGRGGDSAASFGDRSLVADDKTRRKLPQVRCPRQP